MSVSRGHILLVEDEAGIRLTLEDRLLAEGFEVTSRADGVAGEEEAMSGKFSLIILDLMLPRRDGLSVCRNLQAQKINTPILMLTARSSDFDTVVGLRQGADDYLGKPFDMEVLLARIDSILRRSATNSKRSMAGRIEFGSFLLDCEAGILFEAGKAVELNAQEYRLLEHLASKPGIIHERDDLLDKVWSYGADITTRTVDVHIAKLRQRLGESDLPRHILTVRNRGYRFEI